MKFGSLKVEDVMKFRKRITNISSIRSFVNRTLYVIDAVFTQKSFKNFEDSPQKHESSPMGRTTIKHSKSTKGTRGLRGIYNKGTGKKIRQSGSKHKPTFVLDENGKKKRGKCIVCCQCATKANFHQKLNKRGKICNRFRDGMKIATVCVDCSEKAKHLYSDDNSDMKLFQPVHLCPYKRFQDFGIDKTCFEIHHSNEEYPAKLSCMSKREQALTFPKRKRARHTVEDTTYTMTPHQR